MPIKNMGTATMRFSEGIIVSGSATASPYGVQLYVSGNLNLNSASEPAIQFQVGEVDRAKISINTSNNLVLHNQYTNKHIVMKVNDQGTTREGLRIDGAVPEVVVNEGSESLVDFRVESNNNTHMLFVDGGNEKVGIGTSTPSTTLHAYANVSNAYVATVDNDQASAGHGLKVTSDGTGAGTYLLDLESASSTLFRVRGDGRVGIGKVSALPDSTLTVSSSNYESDISIAHKIHHIGDSDTAFTFDSDSISFFVGSHENLVITESPAGDKFKVNAYDATSQLFADKVDVSFYVSGAIQYASGMGPQHHTEPGHSVFGGDLMTSGSFEAKMMITSQEGMSFGQNSTSPMGAMLQGYGQVQLNAGNSASGNELYVMSSSMNTVPVMSALPASGTVGIGAYSPQNTLTVSGSVAFSSLYIGAPNDPGSSYNVTPQDHILLINTNGTAQGGIDSSLDVFLPTAQKYPGMVIIIKDAGGNFGSNNVIVKRTGADYVNNFGSTSHTLNENGAYAQFISDGYNTWTLLFQTP